MQQTERGLSCLRVKLALSPLTSNQKMMRKIGLKRPSKLNLGPKKVSPPTVPGDQTGHRISGVYSDCGLPGVSEGLDVSFDSVQSESLGLYRDDRSQTSGSSSGYGGSGGSTVQSEPLPEYRLAARHSSFHPGSRRQSSHTLVSTPSSLGSPHDLSPTKASGDGAPRPALYHPE